MHPLISVITVTYNAELTLESTILSVINQSHKEVEYIIIDGGSTDGTLDIIRKYADQISCWISEPDKGIYDAMNKGCKLAKGNWIYFLGSGDVLLPNAFNQLLNNTNDLSKIYYGNVRFIPSGRILDGKFNKIKITYHNIPHQAILYPRNVFISHQYNLKYKLFADYVLNLELFSDSNFSFSYTDCIVADYLEGGASSNIYSDVNFWNNRNKLIVDNLGLHYLCVYLLLENCRKIYRFFFPVKR